MHSTHSDGSLNVNELIRLCKENGLTHMCLTDHDTIEGVKEAYIESEKAGIECIAGFELSTKLNGESVHILTYYRSYEDIPQKMKDFLEYMKQRRKDRMKKMVENMKTYYGFDIDYNKIVEENHGTIARPHLAKEIELKYGISKKECFDKYINEDNIAYVPSTEITPEEGIKMVHECGGLAICAHPYLSVKNDPLEWIKYGIDGYEVNYGNTKLSKRRKYRKFCKKHNLLMTGGSDFHNLNDFKHSNIGESYIEDEDIIKLLEKLENKRG